MNAEVVVPLKYLSNFCRSFDLSFIKFEIDLDLTWSKYCVICEISTTPEAGGANPADTTLTTGRAFQINNA